MALTVNMPQLGESVTEGTIARWLKQPGEMVAKYESIAEVVTDKVNAEIPSPVDGSMGQHIAKEGDVVAVGQPICSIETDEAGRANSAWAQGEQSETGGSTDGGEESPASAAPQPMAPASAPAPQPAAPTPRPEPRPQPAASTEESGGNGLGAQHVTPAVRMLAREHGIDLARVSGSGIGGRVTKKDVLEYAQQDQGGGAQIATGAPAASSKPAPAPAPALPVSAPAAATPAQAAAPAEEILPGAHDELLPLTSIRRSIAEHMVRSKTTSPHAWLMMEVDMSHVARIRQRRRGEFEERYGVKLTYLPFVARAVCEALRQHPTMNAQWSEPGVVLKKEVHLGIAVALEDNLIVPVVRNADRLSVAGLATTMAELGDRARGNRLKLDEIQGGTFTLNNTGALGTVLTQAIINQPQAGIMTMDAVTKRPVVIDEAIAIRPMMNLGLSFDHRINDGLQAARFVATVKRLLEEMDETATLI